MMAHKFVTTGAALLLALGLSACSGDSGSPESSTTDSSGSGSSSHSSDATPTDRSKQVFDAYDAPDALGSTSGKVSLGIGGGSDEEAVTFEVTDVTATADATILGYQLTADDGDASFGMEGRFWYDQPSLQVPGSDVQLQTVTASVPRGKSQAAQERCVCTSVRFAGEDPRPQTVMYPPLPKDATEVEVRLPGLDPVTVPVDR